MRAPEEGLLTEKSGRVCNQGRNDQGHHAHQFDKNVEGWARSVLEGVANGVADGCIVGFRALRTRCRRASRSRHLRMTSWRCPRHHRRWT